MVSQQEHGLGALVRPTDPRELRYSLVLTTPPPAAVDLNAPRLLADYHGKDVRPPVGDQGRMGSCASWASIKAVEAAGVISGRAITPLAPGPLYEQARRKQGWFPEDSGSYLADNLDLLLLGGPAIIEPYRDVASYDYDDAAWTGKETRDYAGSHRPFYPSAADFLAQWWTALDAGMPIVAGFYWPSEWFTPGAGGKQPDVSGALPSEGHAVLGTGIVPGWCLFDNQWGENWSTDAASFGFRQRPGSFAVSWAMMQRLCFEARAVSFEPVPEPPQPPEPQPPAPTPVYEDGYHDCQRDVSGLLVGDVAAYDAMAKDTHYSAEARRKYAWMVSSYLPWRQAGVNALQPNAAAGPLGVGVYGAPE